MKQHVEVCQGVYMVGGDGLSEPEDCCVYLVDCGDKSLLIDTGAGVNTAVLESNIASTGLSAPVSHILLTHGHIDHIGGASALKTSLGSLVIAHTLELPAIEEGRPALTAAGYYGIEYQPVAVDIVLHGKETELPIGNLVFDALLTPGHTPGSLSVWVDTDEGRILFGQDIHGPFNQSWGSNLNHWRQSMRTLLELGADILCEGHFGIIEGAERVRAYIERYLRMYR